MNLWTNLLIAISLSMDAFSIALSIGTLSIPFKKTLLLSLVTGCFHFFMPILGMLLGVPFVNKLSMNTHLLSGIIFLYIAIEMLKEFKSEKENNINLSFAGILLFALGVSLDSFGVGFTLNMGIAEIMKITVIFAIFSALFTIVGLYLGKFLNEIIGSLAILLGSIIMLILSLTNFVNLFHFN